MGVGVSVPGRCVYASGGRLHQGGGSAHRACPLWGGVSTLGVSGIPTCTEADTHPLWTESQTPVKTLPWPQFVVASKNNEKIPGNLLKNLEKSWKYHGILSVQKSGNPEILYCVRINQLNKNVS